MEKKTILFIGHDLKFLRHVTDHFSAKDNDIVRVFQYKSHALQGHHELAKMLPGTDLIFCEWGLGNLSWLSRNKLPGQKLVVRIHLQEFVTDFLKEADWSFVDHIILVGPLMLERFQNLFPEAGHKASVICNLIDVSSFDRVKNADAMFNLGLLGILPCRKSPHIGLEILKQLKEKDSRYKLYIKSKRPDELTWLWERPDERKYYEAFFKQINSPELNDSVIWDPHGQDVQEWFQKVGVILSTSDFESFHMSIPEGMSSGAFPLIRDWDGSKELYPGKYIFHETRQAVEQIRHWSQPDIYRKENPELKKFARKNFDLPVILQQYDNLFQSLLQDEEKYKTKPSLRSLIRDQFREANETANKQEEQIHLQTEKIKDCTTRIEEQHNKLAGLYEQAKDREERVRGYRDLSQQRLEKVNQQQELLQKRKEIISQLEDIKQSLEQLLNDSREKNESLKDNVKQKQEYIQQQQQLISQLKEMIQAHLVRIKNLDETILIQQFKIQYLEQKFLNKLLIIGKELIQYLLMIIRRKLNKHQ